MAVNYLHVSAVVTILSFTGLHFWTATLLESIKGEGLIEGGVVHSENFTAVLKLLLTSHVTIALLLNFLINLFALTILCLKTIFFVQLFPSEIRKTLERLFNYVIYKGAFLPLVVPGNVFQAGLWSTWIIVLSSLKMFQTLAKDRLEQLNASPSASRGTYFRVFSALLFVLFSDITWMWFCVLIYGGLGTSLFLLMFLEPLSIAFETMQAILVHSFQLLEMWRQDSLDSSNSYSQASDKSAGGSLSEWKSKLIRNFGFFLDTMTLLMALGHYLIIWWLHGMAFHLIDAVLFLNLRALVSAIIKRVRGYIKLRKALSSLDVALSDATQEEILRYNDECAICKEAMAKAKRLSCNHLFHLACLRSWLDQGLSEVYSCPTCRRPLFVSSSRTRVAETSRAGQQSTPPNMGLNQQSVPGHTASITALPNQLQDHTDSVWRGSSLDSTWLGPWQNQVADGAGSSSSVRSVGLGRVQLMMRQLASVGETYAHGALEEATWNIWPPQQTPGSSIPSSSLGSNRNPNGLRFRNNALGNPSMSEILTMAERVREILPHVPDELIIEDLQRTNNATTTVNNFLPT